MAALERALEHLARRHPVLAARLEDRDGSAWIVRGDPTAAFSPRDLSNTPPAEARALAVEQTGDLIWSPLDVGRGPLWRSFALHLGKDEHRWGFVAHHFIVDRVALRILIDEAMRIYAAEIGGRLPELPPVSLSYEVYLARLGAWLESPEGMSQRRWCVDHLSRIPRWVLPVGHAQAQDREYFILDEDLTQAVRTCAQRCKTTVFIVLLAAQAALLRSYSTSDYVALKVVTDGRETSELRGVVGNLADRLFVLVGPTADDDFGAVVRAVHEACLVARRRAFVRFDIVQADLAAAGLPSAAPVFNFHPSGRLQTGAQGPLPAGAPILPRPPRTTQPSASSGPYWLEMHDRGTVLSGHVRHGATGRIADFLSAFDAILRAGCGAPARVQEIAHA